MQNCAANTRTLEATVVDVRDISGRESFYVQRTLRFPRVRPNDIDIVTHAVFLHACRALGDYARARPWHPWLSAYAYHLSRDYRQLARHRAATLDELAQNVGTEPPPDEHVLRKHAPSLALRGLDALDAGERASCGARQVRSRADQIDSQGETAMNHAGPFATDTIIAVSRELSNQAAEEPAIKQLLRARLAAPLVGLAPAITTTGAPPSLGAPTSDASRTATSAVCGTTGGTTAAILTWLAPVFVAEATSADTVECAHLARAAQSPVAAAPGSRAPASENGAMPAPAPSAAH